MDGRKIALGHVFQTNEDSHDEIFRTLSVVKQKHNAGNTLFKPFLTIRSDDDKIFLKNDFSPNSWNILRIWMCRKNPLDELNHETKKDGFKDRDGFSRKD